MITIRDNINTLTTAQRQALTDKANAYPFDIFVTIGADGASKAAFQAKVSSLVTKDKVVSIGVDPAHKHTFVRGSRDLGLPDGPEVASAGNAFFRSADIVGGIDAIAAKANTLRVSTRITESATGAPIVVHEQPMASGWWFALGGLGIVVLGVSVWMWLSKRRRERERQEEAELHRAMLAELNNELGDAKIASAERGGPVAATVPGLSDFDRRLAAAERKPRRPSYASDDSVPPPVVIQQSQSNDLLTGILLADALSDHHHHTTTVVHHESPAPRSSYDSGSSSSSSSWSDSSSSSSWGDSSSSSSWDSGGSSSGSDW